MAFKPHKFGRYIIVDPIAVGGMAEIYRARLASSKDKQDGPDRIIVIKKVIANLSQNSEFLQMFEAEIKITVGLTHPNIVQIYDYGRVSDQSFLAMEYVEGKNLRQFVSRLAEAKQMFPIDVSCHIVSQVCQALSYAHNFKDRFTGNSLQIVHRDISPQNIMISYEGAVKLFDFGIAKAKSAGESTRAGVIKGKPSYLSPEQISGEELDGRSDIFALGIVLWELLTAKRLFVAENDMAILRKIQSEKIEPPSSFNQAVPQGLDAIVLKSLVRDRDKRYANADEFQRDLHRFLYSYNPAFNPSDLAKNATGLFEKEIREDSERLRKYLSIEPVDDEAVAVTSEPKRKDTGHRPIEGIVSTEEFNRSAMDEIIQTQSHLNGTNNNSGTASVEIDKSVLASVDNSPPLPSKGPALPPKAPSVSPKAEPPGVAWANRQNLPPSPGVKRPGSDVIPPWAKEHTSTINHNTAYISKRGSRSQQSHALEAELKSGSAKGISYVAIGVAVLALVFLAGQWGYFDGTPLGFLNASTKQEKLKPKRTVASQDESKGHDLSPDERATAVPPSSSPSAQVTVNQSSANQAIVIVKLKNDELYDQMTVQVLDVPDGKPFKLAGRQFVVPIKTNLRIKFSAPNHKSVIISMDVPEAKTVGLPIDLEKSRTGLFSFSTIPPAQVTLKGIDDPSQVFVFQTPISKVELAVGRYDVSVDNDLIGYHSNLESIDIKEQVHLNKKEMSLR